MSIKRYFVFVCLFGLIILIVNIVHFSSREFIPDNYSKFSGFSRVFKTGKVSLLYSTYIGNGPLPLIFNRSHAQTNNGKIFVFGAAGFNSTPDHAWDKFHVYGQRFKLPKETALLCCLKFSFGEISQRPIDEDWEYYTTDRVPMPLFYVVCNNDRHAWKHPEQPKGISVVYAGSSCHSNTVNFIEPYFPLKQDDPSFAITTKISHGNLSPELVITWMEAYLWLGMDLAITHVLSNISTDARKVLEYYAGKKVLELHEYTIPGLDELPRSLPQQWTQTWTDAAVPMFDAYARHAGFTLFSVIDWDEFIIPSRNRTLEEYMGEVFARNYKAMGCIFNTQYYITSTQPEDSDIFLKKFVHRLNKGIERDRPKLIYRLAVTKRIHSTHHIAPKPGYTLISCNQPDAYIRHFRGCLPQDTEAKDCLTGDKVKGLVKDYELSKWADNIAENVRKARAAIFPT